jgi:radical SAM superfamily enzyme YgiQ (UPF0313 family)
LFLKAGSRGVCPLLASCYPGSVKILLVGINAKYIQTNLAIRLLRAYAHERSSAAISGTVSVDIAEWNVNLPAQNIVRGIYESEAYAVFFSVYIWNREITFRVIEEVRKVMPDVLIACGGPEVSWSTDESFDACAAIDAIFVGEGERTFADAVDALGGAATGGREAAARRANPYSLRDIPGIALKDYRGSFRPRDPIEDLGTIPFPYERGNPGFSSENRIVYYESSRGCPYSCAYCLSSLDRSVRYYPLERVFADISFFLEEKYTLVKFVDRTFNLDPGRYLEIWRYIRDRHNGLTLFHFEIAAERLSDDALEFLATMPEGAVQLEIGIQSANTATLAAVGRLSRAEVLAERISRIPKFIHSHVDLIAGLPEEGLESFRESFDFAFALEADMVQVGFLKVLAGTKMEEIARSMPLYAWSSHPPYEVLSSPWMGYRDLLVVKDVEHLVDTLFNSGLARNALLHLAKKEFGGKSFALFERLADFSRAYYSDCDLFLPRRPSDSFACLAGFIDSCPKQGLDERYAIALEWLRYDFLLMGKPGAFPLWYDRRYSKEGHDGALLSCGILGDGRESRKNAYARTEFESFSLDPSLGPENYLFIYDEKGKFQKKPRIIKSV